MAAIGQLAVEIGRTLAYGSQDLPIYNNFINITLVQVGRQQAASPTI
jgi:hypothetical protein